MKLHYAHLLDMAVQPGQIVKVGQVIGRLGKSGDAAYSPHCHFEVVKEFRGYTTYTKGLNLDDLKRYYMNPQEFLSRPGTIHPIDFDHFGYRFGQMTSTGVLHPGDDLNRGSGAADLGLPVRAAASGIIEYARYDNGWGFHVWQSVSEVVLPVDKRYGRSRDLVLEKKFMFNWIPGTPAAYIYSKIKRRPTERELNGLAYGRWEFNDIFRNRVGNAWLYNVKP